MLLTLAAWPAVAAAAGTAPQLLHLSHVGPAFVVGPQAAQRMEATVRGRTIIVGRSVPIGASSLGQGVTAISLPADLQPDEPVLVRIEPPGIGAARIVADDPAIEQGLVAARAGGIMLGVLLAVLLIQLAAWTFAREGCIIWYAGFIVALGALELARQGVVPVGSAELRPFTSLMLLDVASALCVGFAATYLRLRNDDRDLFWGMLSSVAPLFALTLASALMPPLRAAIHSIEPPLLLLAVCVVVGVTILRARRFPPAWTLLIAFGMLFLNVAYRALRGADSIALPFLDHWAFEASASADALMFGVALIVRSRYVAVERLALERRLGEATHAAEHDPLTGALNRRGLFAQRTAFTHGTLFYIDLDGFKAVNDRLGHGAGDVLLAAVVHALHDCAGDGALVARLGGDEFAVVVEREDRPSIERTADRIVEAIAALRPEGLPRGTTFGASVGFAPLSSLTLEHAMRIADTNAYRMKARKTTFTTN